MQQRRIRLTIDTLAMQGMDHGHGPALVHALEQELNRLVDLHGLPDGLNAHLEIPRIRVDAKPKTGPEQAGISAARNLFSQMRQANRHVNQHANHQGIAQNIAEDIGQGHARGYQGGADAGVKQ